MESNLKNIIEQEITNYLLDKNLFLVDVSINPTGKISIFADGQININIDQCAALSRHVEHYMEENNLWKDNHSLEVSSPGMSEPLKVPQQFEKHLQKEVEVLLKSGIKTIGTLQSFTKEKIEVTEQKMIKNKLGEIVQHSFSMEEIKSVKKHFNFKNAEK